MEEATGNTISSSACSASGSSSHAIQSLAFKAREMFESGDYDAAVALLQQLQSQLGDQPKVLHNIYLAVYCRDGDFGALEHAMTHLKQQIEKTKADSASETTEDADIDLAQIDFSCALMAIHKKDINKALTLLQHLLQSVEPLDEVLVCEICCTYLQLVFSLEDQHPEATQVLQVLERTLSSVSLVPELGDSNSMEWIDNCKSILPLFKAQHHLITPVIKSAKKEIHSMVSHKGTPSDALLLLQAQIQFLKNNYKKATKLLAISTQNERIKWMYFNNMGCIHFANQQYSAASLFFAKSLSCIDSDVVSADGGDLSVALQYPKVVYNTGMALLSRGRCAAAMMCFNDAVVVRHQNPRIWIRMAECCMVHHTQQQTLDNNNSIQVSSHRQHSNHRYILPSKQRLKPLGKDNSWEDIGDSAISISISRNDVPEDTKHLTLEDGIRYCKTALGLLSTSASLACDENSTMEMISCARTLLSYFSLCNGDPVAAAAAARSLLAEPQTVSTVHYTCCSLYLVEALCMLNQHQEALSVLHQLLQQPQTIQFPQWPPHASELTKSVGQENQENPSTLWINLAQIQLQMGNVDEALASARKATESTEPQNPRAIVCLAYVLLHKGLKNEALQVLKTRTIINS